MKKTELQPEQLVRRCVKIQCLAVGAWVMLLLVCVGVGFSLSSPIGTYATYVVCAFLTVAIFGVCHWEKQIVFLRPETTCIKDSSERLLYLHRVSLVLTAASWLCLLIAAVLMLFFAIPSAHKAVNIYLTDLPLIAIGIAWLMQLAFFAYDVVTLRLWLRMEKEEEKTTV